jgi:dihydropteroate synthase
VTFDWKLRTRSLDVSRGVIIGVVNVTPDSFSDGGAHLDRASAVAAGLEMARQGAAIIDVGGESTRPGATPVTVEEELGRVLPVIADLAGAGLVVSVDTYKPEVAESALEAGAEIINDVTAAGAPGMPEVMARSRAGVILMHMKGSPRTMQDDPSYDDVLEEVSAFLEGRKRVVVGAGADPSSIAVDPGIGFGKTVQHNLLLIGGLHRVCALGHPVVLGASRKSFLGRLTGIDPAEGRDGVTAVTTALGFERGARVFRVHDVPSSLAALRVAGAIVSPERWEEWSPDSSPGDSPG